ncbi:MAG: hypothetical protein LBF83_10390 [Spirochaetaceae bacterium]|nr:hypothetical protein [Spirochaetaceae bacterium]
MEFAKLFLMMVGTLVSISAFSFTIYQYRRKKGEQFTALQSGINIDEEKEKLTKELAEQYSQNIITMEEYEHMLNYINKIETKKALHRIGKIMEKSGNKNDEIKTSKPNEKHLRKENGLGEKIKGYIKKEIELAEKIRQKYLDI